MTLEGFAGFSSRVRYTSLPNSFFSTVLPHIGDINELKAVLHVFWLVGAQKGYPRFVSEARLRQDTVLRKALKSGCASSADVLREALDAAVRHGLLLRLDLAATGTEETLYFINNESNGAAVARVRAGTLSLGGMKPRGPEPVQKEDRDIYSLYEQNVGMLTPLIAEELKDAERRYPADWIGEAFREASRQNKRSWKYIARILDRWAAEGKDDGKPGRDTQEASRQDKYLRGRYGHVVQR